VHSRYTHRSSALPGGPLGGFPSMSLTTKGSWIHLGRQASRDNTYGNSIVDSVTGYISV